MDLNEAQANVFRPPKSAAGLHATGDIDRDGRPVRVARLSREQHANRETLLAAGAGRYVQENPALGKGRECSSTERRRALDGWVERRRLRRLSQCGGVEHQEHSDEGQRGFHRRELTRRVGVRQFFHRHVRGN